MHHYTAISKRFFCKLLQITAPVSGSNRIKAVLNRNIAAMCASHTPSQAHLPLQQSVFESSALHFLPSHLLLCTFSSPLAPGAFFIFYISVTVLSGHSTSSHHNSIERIVDSFRCSNDKDKLDETLLVIFEDEGDQRPWPDKKESLPAETRTRCPRSPKSSHCHSLRSQQTRSRNNDCMNSWLPCLVPFSPSTCNLCFST